MNNESGILDTSTKYSSFAPFSTPSTDSDAPNKYKMLRKKKRGEKEKRILLHCIQHTNYTHTRFARVVC